jgi:type VI secretion system secreted protein Hcp
MSNSGSAASGGGGGAGKVNVQDLSFTKYVDSSTPKLMLACCGGTHYDDATLVVRKAGGKPVEYIKIKMTEVLITSLSTGGSGGEDRLTENVTLNFAKVTVDYVPQKDDGTAGTAIPMSWDIAANDKD